MNNLYLVLFSDPLKLIIEYLKPIDLINLINVHPDFLKLISYAEFKESLLKEINVRLSLILSKMKSKSIDIFKKCLSNEQACILGPFIVECILGIEEYKKIHILYKPINKDISWFFINCDYKQYSMDDRYENKRIVTFIDLGIKLIEDDSYNDYIGYYINSKECLYIKDINDIIKRQFTLSSGSANEYFVARKYQSYGFKFLNDHLYKNYIDDHLRKKRVYRLKEINKETAFDLARKNSYHDIDFNIEYSDIIYILDGFVDLNSYQKVTYTKCVQVVNRLITMHNLIILDGLYVLQIDNINKNTMLLIDKRMTYNR